MRRAPSRNKTPAELIFAPRAKASNNLKPISSPTATKYRKCRSSILILYRYWYDSKDVLDASVKICQISLLKQNGRKKKPKPKTARGKRLAFKPVRESRPMATLSAARAG
jgi:hypothetical protein